MPSQPHKTMTSFASDYNNGAHPLVLQHLVETNSECSLSYGDDIWSRQAREKIRQACQCPDADIFFLVGGTQTNATVIDGVLTGDEGVIAVSTGHINVHESGAIEANGHKIITLPSHDGKMTADDLERFHDSFYADPVYEHMVIPGIVYITLPTELGTIYNKEELEAIFNVSHEFGMLLYVDGARLAYGLMAEGCDFDLPWLAHHCDAFYIGGTKCGALCGEAVVFPNSKFKIISHSVNGSYDKSQNSKLGSAKLGSAFHTPQGFFTHVKAHGALLAKSRLAGVQFDALFTDGLYFRIGQHAIDMAVKLRRIFQRHGYELKPSPTNQQFVVLENAQMQTLMQHVLFETWEPIDGQHTLCRFVTSWATTDDDLQVLDKSLSALNF